MPGHVLDMPLKTTLKTSPIHSRICPCAVWVHEQWVSFPVLSSSDLPVLSSCVVEQFTTKLDCELPWPIKDLSWLAPVATKLMTGYLELEDCTINVRRTRNQWDRVTHVCVGELTIIGSDNGLSPGRRQAIIWTNDGILLTRSLGINFSEISIEIHTFSLGKMHLKMSSAK